MSTLRLEYKSKKPLESCRPGENEIQPGEEVYIELKPKNPLWPDHLKAIVASPISSSPHGRKYLLDFDSAVLNGGPTPDPCDFGEPRCFSCCDAIREELLELSGLAGQGVSSFTYDAATNLYKLTLVNGTELTAPGTRIDTSVPGQVTITGTGGSTVTLPTSQGAGTTYDLVQSVANPGGDIQLSLTGSDGSSNSVVIPTRFPYIPAGTYSASAAGLVNLPLFRMSPSGAPTQEGTAVLDLSAYNPADSGGFSLTPQNLAIITSAVFGAMYPVGEILVTRRSGDPSAWLGFGLWERYGAGRVLAGFDAADADFAALDQAGGTKAVVLTVSQIPAHAHSCNPPAASTSSDGDHTHAATRRGDDGVNVSTVITGYSVVGNDNSVGPGDASLGNAGIHSHSVDISPFDSNNTGGGEAHTNLQPYVVVYMWRRTA